MNGDGFADVTFQSPPNGRYFLMNDRAKTLEDTLHHLQLAAKWQARRLQRRRP